MQSANKIGKKLLSWLMVAVIVTTLLPTTALGEGLIAPAVEYQNEAAEHDETLPISDVQEEALPASLDNEDVQDAQNSSSDAENTASVEEQQIEQNADQVVEEPGVKEEENISSTEATSEPGQESGEENPDVAEETPAEESDTSAPTDTISNEEIVSEDGSEESSPVEEHEATVEPEITVDPETTEEQDATEEPDDVLIAPVLDGEPEVEETGVQVSGYAKINAGTIIYGNKSASEDLCTLISDAYAFVSEFDDEWAAINVMRGLAEEEKEDYDTDYVQCMYYVFSSDFAFLEEDEAESVRMSLAQKGFFMNEDENYPLDVIEYEFIERDRREYAPALRSSSVTEGPSSASNTGLASGQTTSHSKSQQPSVYNQLKYGDSSSSAGTFTPNISLHAANGKRGLCLSSNDSSYDGDAGRLQAGLSYKSGNARDRGIFAILANTNLSNTFDYCIAQAALWMYLSKDGSDAYNCGKAKARVATKFYSGNTSQYTHQQVRDKVANLISLAGSVQSSGIPTGQITSATASDLTLDNGVYTGTVTVEANYPIKIPKSSLSSGATITNASSEDSTFYRFSYASTVTIQVESTDSNASFDIEAYSPYDEKEFWVSVANNSSRQDVGFVVANSVGFGDSRSVTMEGEDRVGTITVYKKDAYDNSLLAGATFRLLDENDNIIEEKTTGTDGYVVFEDVIIGNYTVKEIAAPDGYIVASPDTQSVVVSENENSEVTFQNTNRGEVEIIKTDSDTSQRLEGATFQLVDRNNAVVGTAVTRSNGVAKIENVAAGNYTLTESNAPVGFRATASNANISVTVSSGQTTTVNVTNEQNETSLTIAKVLEHSNKTPNFTFTITLTPDSDFNNPSQLNGWVLTSTRGNIPLTGNASSVSGTFQIPAGSNITIGHIPYKVTFAVSETTGGYTLESNPTVSTFMTSGSNSASGKFTPDHLAGNATFTNTTSPANLSIPIRKTVGPDTPSTANCETFTFTIAGEDGTATPSPARKTITGSGTSSFDLTFTDPGTYKYLIKEIQTSDNNHPGYRYDTTEHHIVVTVTDNNGSLNATWTDNGESVTPITFNNVYHKAYAFKLPVKKNVVAPESAGLDDTDFQFEIVSYDGDPLPANTTLTAKNGETKYFDTVEFYEPGVFHYIVREIPGIIQGVHYDDHEFNITLTVSRDDQGEMSGSYLVDGNASTPIVFFNNYDELYGSTIATFTVNKVITGDVRPSDKLFRFELLNNDGTKPFPNNKVTITGQGIASFESIEYNFSPDTLGNHYYIIKEEVLDEQGYVYDTSIKEAVVTITQIPGTNDIKATTTIDGAQTTIATFTNEYHPLSTSLEIPVSKSIDGLEQPEEHETFTFVMTPMNGAPAPANAVINITDAGTASFGAITFDHAGTYLYSVRETQGSSDNYIYDNAERLVQVIVRDNDGQLTTDWTCDGRLVNAVPFVNKYIPASIDVNIPVRKVIDGDDRPNNNRQTFEFTLTPMGSAPSSISNVVRIVDEDVKEFGTITFDRPGVYSYKATERAGTADGYTYDRAEKLITITVALNNNQMTYTMKVDDVAATEVVFTNEYHPIETSLSFPVSKSITGDDRPDQKETFVFTLTGRNGAPMPTATQVSVVDEGRVSFPEITFTTAGTYTYVMKETMGNAAGYTYDAAEKLIVATVRDNAGRLEATWTCNGQIVSEVPFENEYHVTPTTLSIPVAKSISNDPRPDERETFTFEITPLSANAPFLASNKVTIQDEGEASFPAIVFNEAGEYLYTVREVVNNKTGYTYDSDVKTVAIKVADHSSQLQATYTVNGVENGVAEFINEYRPTPANLTIPVAKTITGDERPEAKETFEFTLTALNDAPTTARNRVTITDEGFVNFGELTFEHAGQYDYVVKEKQGDARGYTYDTTSHAIHVTVIDRGGELKASWTDNGDIVDEVLFTNEYHPTPVSLVVPVQKDVSGQATPNDKTFTFKMTAQYDAPAPENDTVTVTGSGTGNFGAITFEHVGTYLYTVKETAGHEEGYNYNNAQHVVIARVTDNAGNLQVEWTVDGAAAASVLFTNEYVPAPATLKIPVEKTINGDARVNYLKKTFWFEISANSANDEPSLPNTTRISILDEGTAEFGQMLFTEAGTYLFSVKEDVGNERGYTYDTSVRNIEVKVVDNNGTLEATWKTDGVASAPAKFVNTYHPLPVELEIPVSKRIDGQERPDEKELFEFTITPRGTAPAPSVDTIYITDEGKEYFPAIEFTTVGTYTYVIRETAGSADGYTYDRTQHVISVIVKDENGQLVASWTDNREVVSEVSFKNTYVPAPTTLRIPVTKIVEGEPRPTTRRFTFELAGESSLAPIPTNRLVSITDNGNTSFAPITFTESGTYLYSVREIWDDADGYEFDKVVKSVEVTVTDDGGHLTATWTSDGVPVDSLEFTNTYAPEPVEVVIPVEKKITGDDRPAQKQSFEFVIDPVAADAPVSEQPIVTIEDAGHGEFGKIVFEKAGTYNYTVTETAAAAPGYTYDSAAHTIKVRVVDNNGKLEATWTDNGAPRDSVVFTNNYKPAPVEFQIPVTKRLTGDIRADANEVFRFHVSSINGAPNITPDQITITQEGEASFAPATFTKAGQYTYTVIEMIGNDTGYYYDDSEHTIVITVVDNNGALEVESWTCDAKIVTSVEYTNDYIPESVGITIPVRKTVTGNDRPSQKETFLFKLVADHDVPMPVSDTISIQDNGTASFAEIKYTKAGTYTYLLSEINNTADGYTYDDSVKEIKVEVTDNAGRLQAVWTVDGERVNEVAFTNEYAPESAFVTIPVTKTVTGNARPAERETFSFTIEGTNNAPMPADTTITILDEGRANFGTIEYTKAGRYTYTIREVRGSAPGYTYDNESHTIVVTVVDNNGKLSATWTDNSREVLEVAFENNYVPAPVELHIPVEKKLEGQATPNDKIFTFIIGSTGYAPMPENAKTTVTGAATGKFGAIRYTEAGTYKYTVSEIANNEPGYTYDNSEKSVIVTVVDEEGALRATYTVDGVEGANATFTNTYAPAPVEIIIPVSKSIDGQDRPDEKETFQFTMTPAAASPAPEKRTVSIVDDGNEDFGTIQFTEAGTYEYTVKEVMGDANGYTYDTTEHLIRVTVTDNNGKLEATWTDNGSIVEIVPFKNEYTPAPTSLIIPIRKILEGQETPNDKTFTFAIAGQDGAPIPASTVTTTVGAGDGAFESIAYDHAGVYAYTITETSGADVGYQYDNAQHVVIVRVIDNHGQLEATWKVDGVEADAVEFTNTYVPTPTRIKIPVEKVVEGHAREDYLKKTFWFTIDAENEDTLPATRKISICDNGTAEFGSMIYTEAGEYEYTIAEEAGNDRGYTYDTSINTVLVTVVDNNGNLEASWKLNGEDAQAVVFTNNYQPESVGAEIPVIKTIEGNERPEDKTFSFVIEDSLAAAYYLRMHGGEECDAIAEPMPAETEITISDEGTASFTGLTFDNAGVYTYLIHETDAGENSYTYDKAYEVVTIEVTDQNGVLAIKSMLVVKSDDEGMFGAGQTAIGDRAEFVNTYTPTPVDVVLPVSKTIEGNNRPDGKETFAFNLYSVNGAPMPEASQITITDVGTESFGAINYTKAGTYDYILREEVGEADGYRYDRTEHDIQVVVTDNDGALEAVWTDNNESVNTVVFTNTYTPAPVDVIIPVSKDITGNARPDDKETFKFVMSAVNVTEEGATDEQPMPSASTIEIVDAGKASFDAMTYTKAGEYTYTVKESMSDAHGYTYDTTLHTIIVTVVDNAGELEATWTDNGEIVEEVPFTNDYNPDDAVLIIPVAKAISGDERPADKETFVFTLEPVGNVPMPATTTVEITDEGFASFEPITYDKVGTYRYTLTEQQGDAEGYVYDATNHILEVNVTDEDGVLKATWTDNAHTVDNVLFTNEYQPTATSIVLPVEKQITGNTRPNAYRNTFRFTLEANGDAPAPVVNFATIVDEGEAEFGKITFEHAGVYTYTVSEVNNGADGYTYDYRDHTIQVTVTDNAGKLEAVWTDNGEAADEDHKILFVNEYKPQDVSIVIPVIKRVNGNDRPDTKQVFEFTITADRYVVPDDGIVTEQPMPTDNKATVEDAGRTAFLPINFTGVGEYYYTVKETAGDATGYTYDNAEYTVMIKVTDNAGHLAAAWTMNGETKEAVEFVNEYHPVPVELEIPVSKVVTGNNRPDQKENFQFELRIEDGLAPICDNRIILITDEGTAKFDAIRYTEAGTYVYSVREVVGDSLGYTYDRSIKTVTVIVTDDDGTLKVTWNVDGEDEAYAAFTNDYTPAPVEVVIPVSKDITGNERPNDKETFSFTIEAAGVEGEGAEDRQPIPENATVTIRDIGKTSFEAMTYNNAGTYTYTVKETMGDAHGYTYDTAEHTIVITVVDNNGKLEATWTDNGQIVEEVPFTNDYNPDDATLQIPVLKKVIGDERPEAETFTFELATALGAPMPEEARITIADNGTAKFGEITYDTAGLYVYTVSEIAGEATGYTYDDTVHTVIVTVKDVDGVLTATYTIDDQAKEAAEFTNKYQPVPTSVVIPVEKAITGNVRPNAHWNAFKFHLEAVDGAPEAIVTTATIRDEGTEKFGPITFNHSGVYNYTVTEENDEDRGYTYDTTVHNIVVTVVDNAGTLKATWIDNGEEADAEHNVLFTNDYTPIPAVLSIPVSKSVDGHERPEEKETFQFTIEAVDFQANDADIATEQPMPSETTVEITDAGEVNFGDMTYISAGTYNYLVKEVAGDSTGYIYDTTEHNISVVVTDVGGKLIAVWTDNEKPVSEVSFKNEYHPEPTSVELPVSKTLTGNPTPSNKTFTFEIRTTEGAPLPENNKATLEGTSQGLTEGKFGSISYDHTGEYNYLITETHGFDRGYEYDDSEYAVKVTVTDNHGKLEATWTMNGEAEAVAAFTNDYTPAPVELIIPVEKKIEGDQRPADKYKFEFVLAPVEMNVPNFQVPAQPMPESDKITIKDTGSASFGAITFNAAGTYVYTIKETAGDADGYTFDTTEHTIVATVTDNDGKLEVAWTDNDESVDRVTFTNNYQPNPVELVLPIKKALTGNETPEDKEFTFRIEGMDGAPVPQEATVTATGAETVDFAPITYEHAGVYAYVITEDEGDDTGYTYDKNKHIVVVTVTDNNGNLETSWKMDGRYVDVIDFTNEYIPLPVSVIIPVSKRVIGNDREEYLKKNFTFRIEPYGEENPPMPVFNEVEVTDGGFSQFGEIVFTEAGTYKYYMFEVSGNERGYTYDETEYMIDIVVVDDNGTLGATIYCDDEEIMFVTFINEYTPEPAVIELPVQKIVTGDARPEAKDFTFVIETDDEDAPMPDETTLVIHGEASDNFGAMTFDKTGEYHYKITEQAGTDTGYTYSAEERDIVVTVKDNNGALEAVWTLDGKTKEYISFTNEYQPESTTAQIPVKKLLTGNETPEDKTFIFELLSTGSVPMPLNTQATVTGAGNTLFDAITYEHAGTYRYIVREIKGSDRGYTYDVELKQVEVTVTDNDGKLEAVISFVKAEDVENNAATFTNKYKPEIAELEIPVRKTMTGTRVKFQKDFFFQIESEDAPMPNSDVVSVIGARATKFGRIKYTEAGEYRYTITELPPEYEEDYIGYTFDETTHEIIVTVVDNDGELEATWTDNGEQVREVKFENDYTPIPVDVVLPITKEIVNQKPAQASDFRFVIEKDNEAYPDPANTEIVITGEDTIADAFDVHFTKAGKYVYHVYEVDEGKTGYTYTDIIYDVTVVVTDEEGELKEETTITYTFEGNNSIHLAKQNLFVNDYEPIPVDLPIPVNKIISGDHDRVEEFKKTFEFTITDVAMEDHSGSKTPIEVPMPEDNTISIVDEGNAVFGDIHFTRAGIYTYTIAERQNTWTGYTLDERVFTVTVTVIDNWGRLEATWEAVDNNDEAHGADVTFDNEYVPLPVDASFPASKLFTGNERPTEKTFTFTLEPSGVTGEAVKVEQPMPEGTEDGVKTITVIGPETKEFGTITFTYPGEYLYTVKEIEGSETGYTYDDHAYVIKAVVTDNDGQLVITWTVDDTMQTVVYITNDYTPIPVDDAIRVTKLMTGEERRDSEKINFVFEIEAAGVTGEGAKAAQPMPNKNTLSLYDIGTGEFGSMHFVYAGEYTYKITEIDGGDRDYTYDAEPAYVTIKVVDNDGRLEATQTFTKADATTSRVEFENDYHPYRGRVLLEKKGLKFVGTETIEENGFTVTKPIFEERYMEDATFEIYAAETIYAKDGSVWFEQDELATTITTTGTEGGDRSIDLPFGDYYVVEVSAPENYVFSDEHYPVTLAFKDLETIKVDVNAKVNNDYLPVELSLDKEMEQMRVDDTEDGLVKQSIETVPGEGFVFGVFTAETIDGVEDGHLDADTLVATGVSDAEGKVVYSGYLPHGQYYAKEIKARDGWKLSDLVFDLTITHENNDETDNVIRIRNDETVHDEIIWYPVTLTKTDITGVETVPGALIEVKDADGNLIYKAITDENGEIPDIPVVPGKYTFTETIAPEGYALNVAVMTFTVNADGTIEGDTEIRDDYSRIQILKLDENNAPLAGVEFTLEKVDGSIKFTAITNENGIATFEKIPFGDYTIKETKPAPGYIMNGTTINVTVDGKFINQETPRASLVNLPNIINLLKVDLDGSPLAGAIFTMYDEDGNEVATATSAKDGSVIFTKIPYGEYTILETTAPAGFMRNPIVTKVIIDANYRNSKEPRETIVNQPKKISLKKVDTEDNPIANAEFSLINADTGETFQKILSNANGELTFTKFDVGNWIIRETKAPAYFNAIDDIVFTVDENWKFTEEPINCIDIPNYFEFLKVDNEGTALEGVTFTIEDKDGNILAEAVSDKNGFVRFDGLTPGEYVIREKATLEGYMLTDEVINVNINSEYVPAAKAEDMKRMINYKNIQTGVEFTTSPWLYVGIALVIAAVITAVVLKKKKNARAKAEALLREGD